MNKKIIYVIIPIIVISITGVLIFKNLKQEEQSKETTPLPQMQVPESGYTHPEDRGDDFSFLSSSENIKRLTESKDMIERRKAAKVIGDRFIAGTLKLTSKEKETIEKITIEILQQSKSPDMNVRGEAQMQVQRLWGVAAPTLLKYIDSNDAPVSDMAINSLVLMCNEEIIKEFINLAKNAKLQSTKDIMILTLKNLQLPRKPSVPDRQMLSPEELDKLYNKLVIPALKELQPDTN
jgi:hypothetical protein